jgi:hypothetical protein
MKHQRAAELLQGQGNRLRCSVEQLISLPRVLLLFILLCLTPSAVARIACVSSRFRNESRTPQFWNGILMWPSVWLSLPRTDLFQSYMLRVFRVDLLFMTRFMGHYFPQRRDDEEDSQQDQALCRFFQRGLSLFQLFEFKRLRPYLYHRLYAQTTPRGIRFGGEYDYTFSGCTSFRGRRVLLLPFFFSDWVPYHFTL